MKDKKKVSDYYPITVRTLPNGEKQEFITSEDLKDYTIPAEWGSLCDYLTGSTRYLQGIYPYDVEGWLNHRGHVG
jgi:hypothetical protein